MVAALGSGHPPSVIPPLDSFPAISSFVLHRDGRIPPNAIRLRLALAGGAPIEVTIDRMDTAPLFRCPLCSHRVVRLYIVEQGLRCRHCIKARYACQPWRMDVRRVVRMRQRIGADPKPFGAVPPRPVGHGAAVYDRAIVELSECENRILATLSNVSRSLERRAKRGARKWSRTATK